MTKLRLAEEADLPTILEMGEDMFANSSFAPLTYSRSKSGQSILHGMKTALVIVSLTDDGEITGCMHGDVIEPWYTEDRMGIEYFVYVRPEYRGTLAAWMLIKAWVRWAVDSGAKQIRPATAAVSEPADRLYKRMGFSPAGSLYVMNQEQFGA